MNWNDSGQLPVHAVAEYAYCPRSAYGLLFGIETATAGTGSFREGLVMHDSVDAGGGQIHRGFRVQRSLRVASSRFGLVGVIDQLKTPDIGAVELWEYKRGRQRDNHIHELQVALLALCLKETTDCLPTIGVVWTTGDRRSRRFAITPELLDEAEKLAGQVRGSVGAAPAAWPRHSQPGCTGCIYRYLCWTEDELGKLL